MFTDVELWIEIRCRVSSGELSRWAACAEYDIQWETLQMLLSHSEPPGYRLPLPPYPGPQPGCCATASRTM